MPSVKSHNQRKIKINARNVRKYIANPQNIIYKEYTVYPSINILLLIMNMEVLILQSKIVFRI